VNNSKKICARNDNVNTVSFYDATNQLTADGTTTTVTYDAAGNRNNGSYNQQPGNLLQSDGTWTYAYDYEGNETSKTIPGTGEQWTYGYDHRNHLTSVSHKPTTAGAVDLTVTYVYDALGNRIEQDVWKPATGTVVTKFALDGWKTANGHLVGNDNWDVWAGVNSDGSLKTRYLRGDVIDQVFARVDKSGSTLTPYWDLNDRMGSVRDVTDNQATVVDSITYGGFGNITAETNSTYRGRYAWTGRELDVETGLQFKRARYYDSGTGRWLTQDPLGFDAGDSNLYRYVTNKPTVATDPSGFDEFEWMDPFDLRFSQRTAGGVPRGSPPGTPPRVIQRRQSMARGWVGEPLDAVLTTDGVVTLDNTRAAVAREVGMTRIPVTVHAPSDPLTRDNVGRFGKATTWGEALDYRTAVFS
jgi:RHS repeat-associated protein